MIESITLANALNEELKPFGFSKKGLTWYLRKEDVIAVLNLQKSNYDDAFFINLGFWLRQIEDIQNPKGEQCHVLSRAEELWPKEKSSIIEQRSEDNACTTGKCQISEIKQFVREKIIPLLCQGSTLVGLVEILAAREGFLVRRIARPFLGMKSTI
jgi:hypothetical protein